MSFRPVTTTLPNRNSRAIVASIKFIASVPIRFLGQDITVSKSRFCCAPQLQHAWATTVETVGMFLGEALKASTGPENWLRFFALMGSAVAMMEKQPLVPGTPNEQKQLVREIDQYAYNLNVANRLRTYTNAIQTLAESNLQDAHYFLLQLDPNPVNPQLKVTGFSRNELPDAQAAYEIAEVRVKENPGTDAVLVSVDSIFKPVPEHTQTIACGHVDVRGGIEPITRGRLKRAAMADPMRDLQGENPARGDDMTAYAFWNNKGGVGKSFLCFVAASEYSHRHPNTDVYVIDLCPQANSSETLLGGYGRSTDALKTLLGTAPRATIAGYLERRLNSPFIMSGSVEPFVTEVCEYNSALPSNLYLVCGDNLLELLSEAIRQTLATCHTNKCLEASVKLGERPYLCPAGTEW